MNRLVILLLVAVAMTMVALPSEGMISFAEQQLFRTGIERSLGVCTSQKVNDARLSNKSAILIRQRLASLRVRECR